MSWHPLNKPSIIAAKATVEQIEDCLRHSEASFESQATRLKYYRKVGEPVHIRRLVSVIEGIEKKIVNLKEALRLKGMEKS